MDLPIKKAVFDPKDPVMGLQMISLVQDPAIQISWITMGKQEPIKINLTEEGARTIFFTPVLIPGQRIYRNINGEEFDLVFDADTIEQISLRWVKDHLSSTVDTEHSQQLIPGVTFFESVLSNEKRWSNPKGFEALPLRTWFLTGEVTDKNIIAKIKAGELTGVSIDGLFKTMNVQASKDYSDKELQNILSHIKVLALI